MSDKEKLKIAVGYIQWILDQWDIPLRDVQDEGIKTIKIIGGDKDDD